MYTIPTPEELRQYRHRLGKTQAELASQAGVSQSLIARIEKGTIDPRVSTLKKIINALQSDEYGHRPKAKDIMRSPIIALNPEDPIKKASKIMEDHNISQLPVLKKGIQVGSISESRVIHELTSGKNLEAVSKMKVKDLMGSGFPIVTSQTDMETLSRLVEYNPCVLVIDRDTITGIVTKSDVLKLVK